MNQQQRLKRAAPLLVLLAGACWGLIGLFSSRLAGIGFSAVQTVFLRFASAAVLIWLYILFFDREKMKIRLRDIWMFIGTGLLSLTLFSTLYFTTIKLTTLSLAAILLYTAPSFVMLLSAIFFREKIGPLKLIALGLAFFGCICTTGLLSSGVGRVSTLGILTGIGSGFGYALYSIFGTVALKKYNTVTVTAYTFLVSALALLPFCADRAFFALFAGEGAVTNALGLTLISTLAPYLLYTLGLQYIQPGKASILAFSEPLVATLTGILAFRERPTMGGIIGVLLIFASLLLVNYKRNSHTERLRN